MLPLRSKRGSFYIYNLSLSQVLEDTGEVLLPRTTSVGCPPVVFDIYIQIIDGCVTLITKEKKTFLSLPLNFSHPRGVLGVLL